MTARREPTPIIVHEGRGGYIEVGGERYPIEHVSEGRFTIHVPRARKHAENRAALERFVAAHPETWAIS